MKITFLGTSHGNPEANRFCSCTAVETGGKTYLIDAGSPILYQLLTKGIQPRDVGGIFITHPHDDHYFGLIEYTRVVNVSGDYEGVSTPVFIPKRGIFSEMINCRYNFKLLHGHGRTVYKVYKKGLFFDKNGVKVTAIPVKHMPFSYAFLLEAEGKKVLFSGDLRRGMPDYPSVLFTQETDLLVLEGAHTPLNDPQIIDKLKRSKIKALVVNHINPARTTEDVLAETFSALAPDVKCMAAFDGLEMEL